MLRVTGHWLTFASMVLACMCCTVAETADQNRESPRTRWVPLFNGKNLEGWRVIEGNPRVVNGELCLDRGTEISTIDHFGIAEFRMEYECEGVFVVTVLEDSEIILDGLRLFPQQRKRPVEGYISVAQLVGDNLYRITVAYSRAWALSHGTNIVRSKAGRYQLRIRVGPESNVRFKYIEVAKDGSGLDF